MGRLIKLGLLLIVGILVYNLFFGDQQEKAQAKEIFGKVGDLAKAGISLLKSEKEKFDEGKYDEALDKIGGLFDSVRNRAEDLKDSQLLREVARLEEKRQQLKDRVNQESPEGFTNEEKDSLRREWKTLMEDSEKMMQQLDKQ